MKRQQQRGMALVAALFLIVMLAMLAIFTVRVGAAGDQDANSALMQSRALAAARSGLEYGAYRALKSAWCNTLPPPAAPVTANLNRPAAALSGFAVTVSCSRASHVAGAYFTYQVSVVARKGTYGTADYVSRSMTRVYATGTPPP